MKAAKRSGKKAVAAAGLETQTKAGSAPPDPAPAPPDPRLALVEWVCELIARGASMREIFEDPAIQRPEGLPARTTFLLWVMKNEPAGTADHYARACEIRAEIDAEEIREISDDASLDYKLTDKGMRFDHEHVQRSKLRVDTRKFIMARRAPKRWGEKLDITSDNKPLLPKTILKMFGQEIEL